MKTNKQTRRCVDRIASIFEGKAGLDYACDCYVCTRLMASAFCFAKGCQMAVEELQAKLAVEQKKLIIVP